MKDWKRIGKQPFFAGEFEVETTIGIHLSIPYKQAVSRIDDGIAP